MDSKLVKKSKIIIAYVLVLMVVLSLFTGCTNGQVDTPPSTDEPTKKQPTESPDIGSEDDREMEGNMYITGLPIVKEPVTIKIVMGVEPDHVNFNEKGIYKELEKITNVIMEWEMIPNSEMAEKVNLMFTTDEYPEAFIRVGKLRSTEGTWQYAKDGYFIPLEELVEKYCPNIQKVFEMYPYAKENSVSPDGHIYTIPQVLDTGLRDIRGALFINRQWLDHLNLDMPQTTEDYRNALLAFKENDCNQNGENDEIPYSGLYGSAVSGYYDIFGAFGVYDAVDLFSVIDGKVVYEATREEYKNALKYMNQLYEDGTLDPEIFTQDQSMFFSKQVTAKDEIILGSFVGYQFYDVLEFDRAKEIYQAVTPLKGPDGHQMWRRSSIVDYHLLHITDKCKEPAVLMRVIDTLNDEYWSICAYYGVEDINWKRNEDGTWEEIFTDDPEALGLTNPKGPYSLIRDVMKDFLVNEQVQVRRDIVSLYAPYITDPSYKYPYNAIADEKDSERLSIIETDLSTYLDRMHAKFITEGGIDEGWDAYVEESKRIGLEELLEIKQRMMD